MVIPCASRPLRTWPVQYVECGVESDDEDLPSLDVGGARGAMYEVVATSDHEKQNTRQEYRSTDCSSLYVVQPLYIFISPYLFLVSNLQ